MIFNLSEAVKRVNQLVLDKYNRTLTDIEIIILQSTWHGDKKKPIVETDNDLSLEATQPLWDLLSELLGCPVHKSNFKDVLREHLEKEVLKESPSPELSETIDSGIDIQLIPYPSGPLGVDNPFYLERRAIESEIRQEIQKPGALVRIKAPQEMGKTSLLLRILDYCQQKGYQSVSLNMEKIDQSSFSNLDQFLRRLCKYIARKLNLDPKLDEYWDDDLDGKMNWTLYFEDYLLKEINTPIVLAFDEVNHLFEHPNITQDFLPLLRSCYEDAQRIPIWQKLRLIVVHNTEIYIPLQIHQSPFNVGLPIQLKNFTLAEVKELARRYKINWKEDDESSELMKLVGGHPALIHLSLYHLSSEKLSLAQLLKTATSWRGIYAYHLRHYSIILNEQPELLRSFETVVNANQPVSLDPDIIYQLSSLGLIKSEGDKFRVNCELYRQYFGEQNQDNSKSRERGMILTEKGLKKLHEFKQEWQDNNDERLTLEKMNEVTGLHPETIMKILSGETKVDKKSIKCIFDNFKLVLEDSDYYLPRKNS